MNITKRDVLELRRRLTKKECTIGRMCGCYVNGSKNVILKFAESLVDLEDEEFYKYLEIAKKALSGTLGNNLLELEFAPTDDAAERQQFLLALKSSKLKNDGLLDRLYEQIIEHYACTGNYLILVFHDIYDVITRTDDRAKLDESEEIYEYMICAICPVELSKAGLGYREAENRIGARMRDWVVGLPDLGFTYPAFSDRSSDVHAVMYYVKNGKDSHPEFIENVLGCGAKRTATEEKNAFASIVKNAFGEQEEQADRAFLKIQKNLSEIAAAQEMEEIELPPVPVTRKTVAEVISDVDMPEAVKQRIEQDYAREFDDAPPAAQHLLDRKLVAASTERARVAELEQEVVSLRQQLRPSSDDDTPPWEELPSGGPNIIVQVPEATASAIQVQLIDGRKCLVIPLADSESASINGVSTEF